MVPAARLILPREYAADFAGRMTIGRRLATVVRVQPMARKDRLGPVERDALVAGALAVVVLVCSATDGQGPSIGPGDMAIAAATCAPLAVRSLWPLPVLAAVVAGTFASIATYDPSMIIAIPAMVALYTVAMRTDRRTTIAVAVVAVPIVVVMISLFSSHGIFAWETAKNLAVALLPLALGSAKRDHHAYIAAIEERAERAERTREEEALRRVGEERLRIARELHDVVAHAMVAINVQAGVAAHLIDRQPESARGALQQIKRVSGEALTDLRATLGVLREGDDGPAPTRPTQGLDALEELADGMRAAGVDVTVEVTGDRCTVPSPIASALLPDRPGGPDERAAPQRVGRCDRPDRGPRRQRSVEVLDDGPCQQVPVDRRRRGRRGHRQRPARDARAHRRRRRRGRGGPALRGRLARARAAAAASRAGPLMPIRVLLADDQALVRAGFRALLDAEDGLEVVAEAADGEVAVAAAREHAPDVVLMDVRMPRLDGLEATAAITADPALADTRVLVLTTFELDEYVFGALRAGASGFLLKDVEPADLLDRDPGRRRWRGAARPARDAAAHRGVRGEARDGAAGGRARRPHGARARGPGPRGRGSQQRRDRRAPRPVAAHGEDPRLASVHEARRPRPRPARRARLRDRARRPGPAAR